MGKQRDARARHGTDPGAFIRALRLELLLREELNSILDGELSDERFIGARITLVELSRDGSRARIWYGMTTIQEPLRVTQTQAAFERAASFFRMRLCDSLPLKRFPELTFRYDPVWLGAPQQEDTSS